jgi:hypothetical protein
MFWLTTRQSVEKDAHVSEFDSTVPITVELASGKVFVGKHFTLASEV